MVATCSSNSQLLAEFPQETQLKLAEAAAGEGSRIKQSTGCWGPWNRLLRSRLQLSQPISTE